MTEVRWYGNGVEIVHQISDDIEIVVGGNDRAFGFARPLVPAQVTHEIQVNDEENHKKHVKCQQSILNHTEVRG